MNEIANQKYTKTQQPISSAAAIPKNINIMISDVLKDKIMLDPVIQYQVFTNDRIPTMLDQNRMNVLIVEQEQV